MAKVEDKKLRRVLAYRLSILFRVNHQLTLGQIAEILNRHFETWEFNSRNLASLRDRPPKYLDMASERAAKKEYKEIIAKEPPGALTRRVGDERKRPKRPLSTPSDNVEKARRLGLGYKLSVMLRDKHGLSNKEIVDVLNKHFGVEEFKSTTVRDRLANPPGYANRITDDEANEEYARLLEKFGDIKPEARPASGPSDSTMAYQLYRYMNSEFGWGWERTKKALKEYTGLKFDSISRSIEPSVFHPQKDVVARANELRDKISRDINHPSVLFELVQRMEEEFGCGGSDTQDVLGEYAGEKLEQPDRMIRLWREGKRPGGYAKGLLPDAVMKEHLEKIFSGTSLKKRLLGYHVCKLARERGDLRKKVNYERMLNQHFGSTDFARGRIYDWIQNAEERGYKQRIPAQEIEAEYQKFLKTHKDKIKKRATRKK